PLLSTLFPYTTLVRSKETNETSFAVRDDRSIVFQGKPVDQTRIQLSLPDGWLAAIRLELLPHLAHGGSILRGDEESTTISLTAAFRRAGQDQDTRVSFHQAEADYKDERYANGFPIIGVTEAWKTSKEHRKSPQTAVWLLDTPVQVNAGDVLTVTLGKSAAGRVRVSVTPFAAQDPLKSGGGEALAKAFSKAGGRANALLERVYFLSTGWDA